MKNGQQVQIICGKDKGKKGQIIEILRSKNKVKVKGINLIKKHEKTTKEKTRFCFAQAYFSFLWLHFFFFFGTRNRKVFSTQQSNNQSDK